MLLVYVGGLLLHKKRFDIKRASIAYRIHVNGIRGKSTVTRYVAAVLRESGLQTFGKTTGTAARVILPNGQDTVIRRRGYPNVKEQLAMLSSFARQRADAVVIECMAVNPDYQGWLEDTVMRSHVGIITNVRIDHQEEMGEGLLDIARSIARTIPSNGTLITAETNPAVLEIFQAVCISKQSQLVMAPVAAVRTADLLQFGHVAHRENVAIGLAVSKLLGVGKTEALQAMVATRPDPGAFAVQTIHYKGKVIKWANLFAVNDKESFAGITQGLAKEYASYHRIAILNNRHDRPSRVAMFCKLAVSTLASQTVVTFGDYERQVAGFMKQRKVAAVALGNGSPDAKLTGEQLLDAIVASTTSQRLLLVGAVNIHTPQAERLLEYLAELTDSQFEDDDLDYYDSAASKRRRFQPAARPMRQSNLWLRLQARFGHQA